ncbi:hypothetical protein ACKFKF_22760 [Phormidesmis sp. 146-12]
MQRKKCHCNVPLWLVNVQKVSASGEYDRYKTAAKQMTLTANQ